MGASGDKVYCKFMKNSTWTPDLEISSWTFDVVKGMSWESCGELADPGLQPKLVPTQQVQREESEDIEDGMEKVFSKSKVYRGIMRDWGRRKDELEDRWKRSS